MIEKIVPYIIVALVFYVWGFHSGKGVHKAERELDERGF